jgi:DNA polymerase-4
LKTADFKTRTRNRKLDSPTRLADRIFRTGMQLLDKETDGTRFRLIGIGVSYLSDPDLADPPDLVDAQATRRAAVEAAINTLHDKFGKATVETGYTFGKGRRK